MAISSIATVDLTVIGDGVSTSFTQNIAKAPMNYVTNGNTPIAVRLVQSTKPATVSISGNRITINFVTPLVTSGAYMIFELFFPAS